MKLPLKQWLEKLGVQDVTELSPEEKVTFEQYDRVLSDGEVTVDKIQRFCESQCSVIEKRFGDINLHTEQISRLAEQHFIYRAIIAAITSPQEAAKRLEEELQKRARG